MEEEERLIQAIGINLKAGDVNMGGLNIHYVTAGTGQPLLLLHGATIGWGQWYPNIAELAKFFSVYALDLPGSGRSTTINFRKANLDTALVEVVSEFIRRMGWQKTHVIGHSTGGWIALKLAITNPAVIDKVILVNSLGFSRHVPWRYRILSIHFLARVLSKTVMRPSREKMRGFLYSVLSDAVVLSEEFVDYFYGNVTRSPMSHPFLFISSLLKYFRMKQDLFLLEKLSRIENQILIVAGTDDPLIPLSKTYRAFGLFPKARIEIFFDTGHVPSIERSQQFNSLVVSFLTESRMRY